MAAFKADPPTAQFLQAVVKIVDCTDPFTYSRVSLLISYKQHLILSGQVPLFPWEVALGWTVLPQKFKVHWGPPFNLKASILGLVDRKYLNSNI